MLSPRASARRSPALLRHPVRGTTSGGSTPVPELADRLGANRWRGRGRRGTVEEPKRESRDLEEQVDVVSREQTAFGQLPPQTPGEVVYEAEFLFSRILADNKAASHERNSDAEEPSRPVFQHVKLTSKLLNAVLSVHYIHSSFDTCSRVFRTLHAEHGVPRNIWSYLEILDRCARAKKGPERLAALQLAEEAWEEWTVLEAAWRAGSTDSATKGMSPRMLERVHVTMIRVLAL